MGFPAQRVNLCPVFLPCLSFFYGSFHAETVERFAKFLAEAVASIYRAWIFMEIALTYRIVTLFCSLDDSSLLTTMIVLQGYVCTSRYVDIGGQRR